MAADQRDPVVTLYRVLLFLAAVGIVVLAAGIVEYVHFEPFAKTSGVHAHITGVYAYNASTRQTSGADRSTFARTDGFAAVVDWSALPDGITAQAVWYDSFGNVVGSAGPATAATLKARFGGIVPAQLPAGLNYHLPGEYIFAVERVEGGQPVEVLARRLVEVERA